MSKSACHLLDQYLDCQIILGSVHILLIRKIGSIHPITKRLHFLAFDCNDLDEDLKSFARCLLTSVLVGIDCKEEYLPQRVAMQFGYDQDLPAAAFPVSSISWENARFAVLPRSFPPCVSIRYFNWLARSKSARKAALRDIKRNQNRSSPSVLAKRHVD